MLPWAGAATHRAKLLRLLSRVTTPIRGSVRCVGATLVKPACHGRDVNMPSVENITKTMAARQGTLLL